MNNTFIGHILGEVEENVEEWKSNSPTIAQLGSDINTLLLDENHAGSSRGPSSEGSSPDPSRAMDEMASTSEVDELASLFDALTPIDTDQASLDGMDEYTWENVTTLDRENAKLKEMLEEYNESNNRQTIELRELGEAVQRMKIKLREASKKNETSESYIERADELCQRLQKEVENQANVLDLSIKERQYLEQEIKTRDKALIDLQDGLERTERLMEQNTETIQSYQKERELWHGRSEAPEVELLPMRLCQAVNMGKASEDMCQSVRSQTSVNLTNLHVAQESIRRTTKARWLSTPFRLEQIVQSSQVTEDQTMIDASDLLPIVPMSIDSQSEIASIDPMAIDSMSDFDTKELVTGAQTYEQHMHQAPGNIHQQFQSPLDDPDLSWFKRVFINPAATQASEQASKGHIAQGIAPSFNYSPTMNWEKTEARDLYSYDWETSSNGLGSMLARKFPRLEISGETTAVGANESTIDFPIGDIKVCRAFGMADQDYTDGSLAIVCDGPRSESKSEEPWPTHKDQVDDKEATSEPETGQQVEEHLTTATSGKYTMVSAGVQTENEQDKTPKTVVQTGSLSRTFKKAQRMRTDMVSKLTQTEAVHVWAPVSGTLPSPLETGQKRRKSLGQDKTRRSAGSVGKVQPKRLSRSSDMKRQFWGVRQGWRIVALALFGFIIYFYWPKETLLWMKANRAPPRLLQQLRNNQLHEPRWMQKMNYELVTVLDIDRVALG